jgi:hypothetical protein
MMPITLVNVVALLACKGEEPLPEPGEPSSVELPGVVGQQPVGQPDAPETCDAGQNVWIQRVFPLMFGRKAHGAGEVQMWTQFAEEHGREAVIRSMSSSPEFRKHWKVQLSDMLYVARSGTGEDGNCFEFPLSYEHDGSLAQWIRTEQPDVGRFEHDFNMADVIIDGLIADDVSVIYQANLFARTNFTAACVAQDPVTVEIERRLYHGDQMLEVYIDRDMDCMGCHNSEFSVTDHEDPAQDHAWGRGALFEKALFGNSVGPTDKDSFYAMNKFYGVVQDFYFGAQNDYSYDRVPWGMDNSCGSFNRIPPEYDYIGQESAFFGQEFGAEGSVWELERLFDAGVNAMSGETLEIGEDGSVEASQAFAYLTGQHFVDQVWRLGFGTRLLLPYGMSRNQYQQQRLQQLTDEFVTGGWSLSDLLVDITADPYFNAGLPETCGGPAYGMKPVIDPYSVVNEGEQANNGPGDLVHRHTGRTLLRSFYQALEFGEPPEYFGQFSSFLGNDDEELQRSLGVFHSDASPGFNGVDFQGVLVWEGQFYGCQNPEGGDQGFLRRLYDEAYSQDQTIEAVALSLKDRLIARGLFEDETERALVGDLLGYPLESKVREVDAATFGRKLGLLCGVLTLSPEFMLTSEPLPTGPLPPLSFDLDADCANLALMATLAGFPVQCVDGMPTKL